MMMTVICDTIQAKAAANRVIVFVMFVFQLDDVASFLAEWF